jgi:hypothetical protein
MTHEYFTPRLQFFGSPRSSTIRGELSNSPTEGVPRSDRETSRSVVRESRKPYLATALARGREDETPYDDRVSRDRDEVSFDDDALDMDDDELSVEYDVLRADDEEPTDD